MADLEYNVEVLPIQFSPAPGPPGDSAYDVAVQNGFVGTETAWLASLVGPSGPSAYAVAVANGYSDTEAAWLESLEGKSAYEVAVANGYVGDEATWLASLIGAPGDSAYVTWLDEGNSGSETDFLNSLVGATGAPGDSAYTIAVKNGFVGTETQWLASLQGPSGSTSWSAITGKPATFPPSPHTHAESDVTNLVADLNARALVSTTVSGTKSVAGGGSLSGPLTLSLVNDVADPGASRFYATSATDVKGWVPYGTAALVNAPPSGNATNAQAVLGSDTRLTDSRIPKAHALSHGSGGSDQVTLLRAQISDLPGLVSTASMGFAPALPAANPTTLFFRGDATYAPVTFIGSLGAHITSPTAKTYTVDLAAPSAYTIIKVFIVLGAGTCTVAFTRNGTGISGINAIAVTATLQAITISQPINANDLIAMAVSVPSGAADLQYSVRYQK